MNSASLLPARLDWPSAIGSFLLNFGTLEYFVFVFLKDNLSEDEFAKVKEWHLKDRLSRIAQYLESDNQPAAEQAAFAKLIARLEPMRELRNHIAHGHMYLRIDPETQKPTVTLLKAKDVDTGYLPGVNHVQFAELQSSLEALSEMIEEFGRLAGFGSDDRSPAEEDLSGRK